MRKALAGRKSLSDRTEALYVSPLKALGNDIQKNLEGPLGEILALAGERGLLMPEIRTAVRTGDTLAARSDAAMLKRPPHILVTTPSRFTSFSTADKSRAILRDVETVIVDEIHADRGRQARGAFDAVAGAAGCVVQRSSSVAFAPLNDKEWACAFTGADRAFGDAEADRGSCAFSDGKRARKNAG